MTRMRKLTACGLLAVFLWQCLPHVALATSEEPLPRTEAARVARLHAVAEAHQLSFSEARHEADTQLLVGAFLLIGSMLTPLIAELRDEDFPALGSVLLGSIGLATVIEGTLDEQVADRKRLEEQIEAIQAGTAQADSVVTPQQP